MGDRVALDARVFPRTEPGIGGPRAATIVRGLNEPRERQPGGKKDEMKNRLATENIAPRAVEKNAIVERDEKRNGRGDFLRADGEPAGRDRRRQPGARRTSPDEGIQ